MVEWRSADGLMLRSSDNDVGYHPHLLAWLKEEEKKDGTSSLPPPLNLTKSNIFGNDEEPTKRACRSKTGSKQEVQDFNGISGIEMRNSCCAEYAQACALLNKRQLMRWTYTSELLLFVVPWVFLWWHGGHIGTHTNHNARLVDHLADEVGDLIPPRAFLDGREETWSDPRNTPVVTGRIARDRYVTCRLCMFLSVRTSTQGNSGNQVTTPLLRGREYRGDSEIGEKNKVF